MTGTGERGTVPFRSGVVRGTTLVALPALHDALSQRLHAHESLYAWAESEPQPRALQGRAVVYVAELPECDTTMAVRHAWHGGVFAPLTGDRFLVPTRAPREAAASITLRARGIDTPELLAYALYPAGPGLRRVDVCTRFVPDSWDFGAVLAGLAPGIARGAAERAVLDLLARLARTGVVHPDLNVKNILLVPDGSGALRAWLLDVDVVQFRSGPPHSHMHRNVGRLARSIRKWYRRHDLPLDEAWLTGFAASALGALP
jgi:3-deoxy-D-manno-octulosonic acid kinase